LPFDAYNVEQWLIALKTGKAKQVTLLGDAKDQTLYSTWLSNTIVTTRTSWEEEILKDKEHDCVVFFYSSENLSYQQRGYAY
jgi:hypothetical protein